MTLQNGRCNSTCHRSCSLDLLPWGHPLFRDVSANDLFTRRKIVRQAAEVWHVLDHSVLKRGPPPSTRSLPASKRAVVSSQGQRVQDAQPFVEPTLHKEALDNTAGITCQVLFLYPFCILLPFNIFWAVEGEIKPGTLRLLAVCKSL